MQEESRSESIKDPSEIVNTPTLPAQVNVRRQVLNLLLSGIAPAVIASGISVRAYLEWQGLGTLTPDLSAVAGDFLVLLVVLSFGYLVVLFYPPVMIIVLGIRWSQIAGLARKSLPDRGLRQRVFQRHWLSWYFFATLIFAVTIAAFLPESPKLPPHQIVLAMILGGSLLPVLLVFRPWEHWRSRKSMTTILGFGLGTGITVLMLLPAIRLAAGLSEKLSFDADSPQSWVVLVVTFAIFAFAYDLMYNAADRFMKVSTSTKVARIIVVGVISLLLLILNLTFSGAWKDGLAVAASWLRMRTTCSTLLLPVDKYPRALFHQSEWNATLVSDKILKITADIPLDQGTLVVVSRPQQCVSLKEKPALTWVARDWVAVRRDDLLKLSPRELPSMPTDTAQPPASPTK